MRLYINQYILGLWRTYDIFEDIKDRCCKWLKATARASSSSKMGSSGRKSVSAEYTAEAGSGGIPTSSDYPHLYPKLRRPETC